MPTGRQAPFAATSGRACASPGPFTTQPITAIFSGVRRCAVSARTRATMPATSMQVRLQVGQEITSTPARRPSARRISIAASGSGSGEPVSDTRTVSPMPSSSSAPMPMALLVLPMPGVPASVTPTCSG